MFSKPLAIALLASACVAAAGGGAFLALRQNAAPGTAAPVATAAPAEVPLVHETEATVDPEPPALELPAPEPADPPAPVRAQRPAGRPVQTAAAPAPQRPAPPAPAPSREAAAGLPAPAVPLERPEPVEAEPARPAAPVQEPARAEAPLPPARFFEDLTVPASAVIGLQIETPVSSERARVEDRVEARVVRDVLADGRTAIPAGSRAIGAVTFVDPGGKLKERARLGVRFHTLVLADGTRLPVRTDQILREGDSPTGESARKIGGAAAGGAILGAIIGGKKGAVLGGATGAAGGTAIVMAGDRNPATLPAGAVVTVRLAEPLTVEVERR